MYEDKEIIKRSIPMFLVLSFIMLGVSLFFGQVSYLFGFILGYGLNLVIFKVITITVDNILLFQSKMSGAIVMMSHLVKLMIYSLGFFLAVKLPMIFNIFTVTIGYFVIKLSIFYYQNRMRKRGEDV